MLSRRTFLATTSSLCTLPLLDRFASAIAPAGRTLHVSVHGSDQNDGSSASMFRTISAAARRAQPGDIVLVHAGIYRERVSPPRGGLSPDQPIVYQAAPRRRGHHLRRRSPDRLDPRQG